MFLVGFKNDLHRPPPKNPCHRKTALFRQFFDGTEKEKKREKKKKKKKKRKKRKKEEKKGKREKKKEEKRKKKREKEKIRRPKNLENIRKWLILVSNIFFDGTDLIMVNYCRST